MTRSTNRPDARAAVFTGALMLAGAVLATGCGAGADAVAGVDGDGNGIRDDVDMHIDTLGESEGRTVRTRRLAAAMQSILAVDLSDAEALHAIHDEFVVSSTCLFELYPSPEAAVVPAVDLEFEIFDTEDRADRYAAFATRVNDGPYEVLTDIDCAV